VWRATAILAFRSLARPAGVLRLNAPETGFLQITLIHERLNETHGIFSTDVIINCCRQQQSLVAVAALYMLHAANVAVFLQQMHCFIRAAPPLRPEFSHGLGGF
jgi:hypothetical protein